uniref:Nischarin n=1 Tax=Scophthalmus maximus TaxID=52904 RepID=A0A8D3E7L1_SCOMX
KTHLQETREGKQLKVYIIEVMDGEHRWTVKHRYSDFHELHEKLTAEKNVDRRLLPPKKILGKNSKSLVERRQIELELYLQTLLQLFPQATPAPLACFLHFHLYEINGITAALAEELFHKGEQLLQAGEVFSLSPLQLYSVSQQLRLAKPTCCNGDAKTDLGHILDFTCRLRYLKISGTSGPVGTSNIRENSLPFDLSVFKSLLQIEISECSSRQIRGLSSLRSSLATMSIHHSTETMMSILVPESSEFSQWEPEGAESGCPVTAIIPVWRNMTTLDMSRNCVSTIDSSVKLIREVEFLDLSHNQLTSVENLQYLYNLVHVDLSYNSLRVLEAAHTRLGNIKTLSLAGNQLERLTGLTKLYSLVNLDLSHNQLAQLEEIRNIGSLPCLEKLNLSSNPMCIIPDYRTKVLAQFGDRAAEVCLDGDVTTEKELDTVEVLKAIQKAKEVKDRMSSGNKKVKCDARKPAFLIHLSVFSFRFCQYSFFFSSVYSYYIYIYRVCHACRVIEDLLVCFSQAAESPSDPEPPNTPQLLPRSLINSWELEESQGAKGGFPAHLLPSSSSSAPDTHSLPSDIISQEEEPGLPSLLFLTHRHLWVLKMGFRELAERQRSNADLHPSSSSSSCCRLVRVPLSSVVLHPRERAPRVGDRTKTTTYSHLRSLTPGLKLLAGLRGEQLLAFFHRYIALSEAEEVRQVLWLSVVLYKSPEAELTCCLLLSTDTIYFLLEDSASTLAHHSGQWIYTHTHTHTHTHLSLPRDSYGTGVFLQELMSALSLQQHLPPPEPSDQDFYSQFTSTNTGKMQNYELVHSSRVKFIYPSEEEMGDLTFIVAERKTPASVQMPNSLSSQASSSSSSGLAPSPVLQPRTLILTSTDVFLLDEDYISHPLPDFAKEPPSRERYQLREARRIRDLDRVLLGYQTYPQALTLVFDDLPGPDLLCHLTMDHFAAGGEEGLPRGGGGCGAASGGAEGEVQWCVFVPGADSRERLISLLARQWEALCSRELPVELTG